MLFLIAVFDSVIVRHISIQLLTPDEMRGRIFAVNNIFIDSSNEFGAVESGLTAALFGPIVSVVAEDWDRFWSLLASQRSGRKREKLARSTKA
jgi:hypothetical protein